MANHTGSARPTSLWLDSSTFHNIAHRGASAYAPGNSLEALGAARQHGATDVEVDLHCTSDGRFVIRHDTSLGQPARFISELTWADYSALCQAQNEPVTSLEQGLEVARQNDLGVYLDVKQVLPGQLPGLLAAVEAADYRSRVVIASFRTDIVREVKQLDRRFLTSVLFFSPNLDPNSLVRGVGCDFLHPCFDIFADPFARFTPGFVAQIKRAGAGLVAWNIKTAAEAAKIVSFDITGACADDPQLIKDALKGRQ